MSYETKINIVIGLIVILAALKALKHILGG